MDRQVRLALAQALEDLTHKTTKLPVRPALVLEIYLAPVPQPRRPLVVLPKQLVHLVIPAEAYSGVPNQQVQVFSVPNLQRLHNPVPSFLLLVLVDSAATTKPPALAALPVVEVFSETPRIISQSLRSLGTPQPTPPARATPLVILAVLASATPRTRVEHLVATTRLRIRARHYSVGLDNRTTQPLIRLVAETRKHHLAQVSVTIKQSLEDCSQTLPPLELVQVSLEMLRLKITSKQRARLLAIQLTPTLVHRFSGKNLPVDFSDQLLPTILAVAVYLATTPIIRISKLNLVGFLVV